MWKWWKNRKPLIGPLGGWELFRLARRGQGHRSRLVILTFLGIAFFVTPLFWFSRIDPIQIFTGTSETMSIKESATFAHNFAMNLLQAILLAIVVMTPAYAASAIAEEKDTKSLGLLLTTSLSDREIVMGKAAGRIGFVLAAAAAGLPVLFFTLLFGGVDIGFLLIAGAIIASTAVLTTAIGINAACTTNDLRSALLRAYSITALYLCGLMIPPLIVISPFGILILVGQQESGSALLLYTGLGYCAILLIASAVLFHGAVKRLRGGDYAPMLREPRRGPRPRPRDRERDDRDYDRDRDRDGDYDNRERNRERVPGEFRNRDSDDDRERVPVLEPLPDWRDPWDDPDRGRRPRERHDREYRRPRERPEPYLPKLPPIDQHNPLLWKERFVSSRQPGSSASSLYVQMAFGIPAAILLIAGLLALFPSTYDRPPRRGEVNGQMLMSGAVLAAAAFLIRAGGAIAAMIARERSRQTLDGLLCMPIDRREILHAKVLAALEYGWGWGVVALAGIGLAFGVGGGVVFGIIATAYLAGGYMLVLGLGTYLTVHLSTEIRAFRFLMPVIVVIFGLPVGIWSWTDWIDPQASMAGMGTAAFAYFTVGILCWKLGGRELNRLG